MNAGGLLHSARRRAGLTQQQLAARAGVTQSVISAYEAGRRQPSLPTLERLVEAADAQLDLVITPFPRRLDRLTGPIGRQVRRSRRDLIAAAERHGAGDLRVFGSVARGEERADSDLDLLVFLPNGMGLLGLGRLREELEAIVDAQIDLVPDSDLKAGARRRIERDAISL